MIVGLLSVELHIPDSRSLKDKRIVLHSIKDRLRKFNVAVAEVEHQDLWQRAGLGIVTLAGSTDTVERLLAEVADEIERAAPGVFARSQVEFLT
jgi:hypothetical protein